MIRLAEKELDALPERVQVAIERRFDQFRVNPFATDIRKLQGVPNTWRVRVGDWRILIELDTALRVVTVLGIRRRREA